MSTQLAIKTQNYTLAIRQELGYPLHAPVCHTLAFASGGTVDLVKATELARHATAMQQDLVYTGWERFTAAEPSEIALALRELTHVDVVNGCFLWAADANAPLMLVAPHRDEHFALGSRGYLERRPGRPARQLNRGKRLARQRVRRAAAARAEELLATNQPIAPGGHWVAPARADDGCVVRFA